MRRKHGGDDGGITHVGGAFVVDDDIVACGVIGMTKDGQRRLGGFVVRVDLGDFDIGAGLEALLQDVLLLRVVMAATAGDEQHAQRFDVSGAHGSERQGEGKGEGEE